MIQYVYVFVRMNMLPVQIAVQACHAILEMSVWHDWTIGISKKNVKNGFRQDHPHLLLLGVKNETELNKVLSLLEKEDVNHSIFKEPDMNNSLTAIATEPINENSIVRKKLRKYKLLPPMIHNK